MLKQKKYDWKDSNMALFGSDLEKNIKKAAAEGEAQWRGVGHKVELRVWRIEQFKVVEWPRRKYGEFHEGDTYIVCNTYRAPAEEGEAGPADKLAFDIHFWIGKYSTQDEYGTAAYKTVELDHILNDAAVQHREVMGNESDLFASYFPTMKLLKGGAESGFRHVEEQVIKTRLFHVKGTKGKLVLKEVKLSRTKMNSGDVFILDTGAVVFQWNGKDSNMHEKRQAADFCRSLRSDRNGRCEITTMDEGTSDGSPDDESDPFWKHLPGHRKLLGLKLGQIKLQDAAKAGDDADIDAHGLRLFRIHEGSGLHAGKVRFTRCTVNGGKVPRNQLQSGDVMLLDTGFHIYLWVGDGASSEEKSSSFPYAHEYIKDHKRPPVMPVTRVTEGKESPKFSEFIGPAVAAQGCCVIC